MAKGIYIGGNNIARKVKKMYIGVNGKARKVKKVYIGDANGKARLAWNGGAPKVIKVSMRGIVKEISNGNSFSDVLKPRTEKYPYTIFFAEDINTYFAICKDDITYSNYLYKSVDNGDSWTYVSQCPDGNPYYACYGNGTIVICYYEGAYYSKGDFKTFNMTANLHTSQTGSLVYGNVRFIMNEGIAFGLGKFVILGYHSGYSNFDAFYSSDGITWATCNIGEGLYYARSILFSKESNTFKVYYKYWDDSKYCMTSSSDGINFSGYSSVFYPDGYYGIKIFNTGEYFITTYYIDTSSDSRYYMHLDTSYQFADTISSSANRRDIFKAYAVSYSRQTKEFILFMPEGEIKKIAYSDIKLNNYKSLGLAGYIAVDYTYPKTVNASTGYIFGYKKSGYLLRVYPQTGEVKRLNELPWGENYQDYMLSNNTPQICYYKDNFIIGNTVYCSPMKSSDCSNFEIINIPQKLSCVGWAPSVANNKLFLTGTFPSSDKDFYYTTDLTNFTKCTAPTISDGTLLTVGYINGYYLLPAYSSWGTGVYCTTDFVTYTSRSMPNSSFKGNRILYQDSTKLYMEALYSYDSKYSTGVFSTTNSTTWTTEFQIYYKIRNASMAYGNGTYVITGANYDPTVTSYTYVYYKKDGATSWTELTLSVCGANVIFADGKFMLTSVGRDNQYYYSVDGINWTNVTGYDTSGILFARNDE